MKEGAKRMQLGIWSSYYIDLSPEDAVLELEKNGISYSELSDEHAAKLLERGEPVSVGAAFHKFAQAHHVVFPQGHLWLQCRLCDKEAAATLKSWLDLFEAVGIKRAVLHCDDLRENNTLTYEERMAANLPVLRELTDYIKGRELVICLENLPGFVQNADDLLWIIHQVGSENLGICLDTGHLHLSKYPDQEAFIKKAGHHLKALHIADNEGETDQHMIPYGRGTVDIEQVVRALQEIGYNGLFNLEIPGERRCPLKVRGYKLEYIKKLFDYLTGKEAGVL